MSNADLVALLADGKEKTSLSDDEDGDEAREAAAGTSAALAVTPGVGRLLPPRGLTVPRVGARDLGPML
jgi:hypothetical protein